MGVEWSLSMKTPYRVQLGQHWNFGLVGSYMQSMLVGMPFVISVSWLAWETAVPLELARLKMSKYKVENPEKRWLVQKRAGGEESRWKALC